jgi:NAD+ synthase
MCNDLGLEFTYLDINNQYKLMTESYKTEWAKSSALPQIRAMHLNSQATEEDLISVGSTNGTEFILAAFSTGGPAGNIAPLIDLYKSEVYAVARDIGVPQYIIDRKPLISELNLSDYSLYGDQQGVDATVLDPILRRLWYQKQSPEVVAEALGHGLDWINDINNKRIIGETCRRGYKPLVINRAFGQEIIEPDMVIDRSYFK